MKCIVLVLFAAALTSAAVYNDPQGRFSLAAPSGWTVRQSPSGVLFASGDAYALAMFLEGGASDPSRSSRVVEQYARQWRDFRSVQNGRTQIAGTAATFSIFTGINPANVNALIRAVTVASGPDALLVLFGCPSNQWEQYRSALGAIEQSITLRASASRAPVAPLTPAVPVPASPAAPAGPRLVPQGFQVTARSGPSGQALTATFNGARSAKAAFAGQFQALGGYFDGPASLQAAYGDPRDSEVQGFFRASFQGQPVRGLMKVYVSGGQGLTAVLFDRDAQFARSLPALARQMTAALPAAPQAQGGGEPARPQPLTRTPLSDNSGYVSLPAGWHITGAFKGTVDISGPNGEIASFGGYQVAYVNPLPGSPQWMMRGPYRDPASALGLYLDTLTKGSLSRREASYRVVEQAPQQTQDGGRAAYITYEFTAQGKTGIGLAFVITKPIDYSQWFFYLSVVAAPKDRFAQIFPTMWEMWKSWSVNQWVYRERMDAALKSMRETTRIIQSVNENRQRAFDNANKGWDQVIRGVTEIEDIYDRRRGEVDTNSVDDVLRILNHDGERYRKVPLSELAHPRG